MASIGDADTLLDRAEAEPIFGQRQTVVRALVEEAAALLDRAGNAALEGRALLRLAQVKLVDADLEGTEQLAARARARLPESDPYRRLLADVTLARAAIRRHAFADAEQRLTAAADAAPPDTTPLATTAAATMALAWAELALEQQDYKAAAERLTVVEDALGEAGQAPGLVDLAFTTKQMRGIVDLAQSRFARACEALRGAVGIAKDTPDAIPDEVHARLALAGALGEWVANGGDKVSLDEAERHLQIARDRALESGRDDLRMATLVAQAGLLARKGQTHAALDRCLEIAEAAVTKRDLPRYGAAVALMSQIYEQRGDLASAYRTYAEAHVSLRSIIGDGAKAVIVPYMSAFADRIGRDRFNAIAEQVNAASHAASIFHREPGKSNG